MTLLKLLREISRMAINQQIINYAAGGSDIYALNSQTIKGYPVLFSSPTGNHNVQKNTTEFSITIYYLDRLLDSSENELDILSTAVEELKNIVRNIEQIPGVIGVADEYQITNFTEVEAMNDRVCGAFCTLNIICQNETTCAQD